MNAFDKIQNLDTFLERSYSCSQIIIIVSSLITNMTFIV